MMNFKYCCNSVIVICTLRSTVTESSEDRTMPLSQFQQIDFEVFGKVQGVFFRKYTQAKAKELDVKGWCKNTEHGTVVGSIQGTSQAVADMMHWLQNTGSPASRIDKVEFNHPVDVSNITYPEFEIRK